MRKSRFTAGQIVAALRQAESGVAVVELCRKLEVTETTFYRWKRQYGGLGVSELRELRQLRDENRKLKLAVADTTTAMPIRDILWHADAFSSTLNAGSVTNHASPYHASPAGECPSQVYFRETPGSRIEWRVKCTLLPAFAND